MEFDFVCALIENHLGWYFIKALDFWLNYGLIKKSKKNWPETSCLKKL